MSYSILDYFMMPVTWIVILLIVIIVQLVRKRECINVHLDSHHHDHYDILNP